MLRFAVFIGLSAFIACSSSGEPVHASGNEPVNAEKIYGFKCALCHGDDGKAGIADATDLSQSKLSLEERIIVISEGRGRMLPFKELLTTEEIEALAAYIEKLRTP